MLKILYTRRKIASDRFLADVLREEGVTAPVLRGKNGKPFLAGDPLFLSLTHSGDLTAVALCDEAVGLDAEDTLKPRAYSAVLAGMPPEEREEITGMPPFYLHWTAKESYIKFRGETLAKLYRRLAFVGGVLSLDEKPLPVFLTNGALYGGRYVFCACTATPQNPVTVSAD